MKKEKYVPLDKIIVEETFRVRESEDQNTVSDYAQVFENYMSMQKEKDNVEYPLPAIHIWCRDGQYILIAGFHRFMAAKQAGMETILVHELTGTEDEVFEFAIQDNRKNGLRLSGNDLKVCIQKTFIRYPDKSLATISDMTGASKSRCHAIKNELMQQPENEGLFPGVIIGKDGKLQAAMKRVKQIPPRIRSVQEERNVLPVLPELSESFLSQAEDDLDIIRWDHLEGVPTETQIMRYRYALDIFKDKLEKGDKQKLYKTIYRWLGIHYTIRCSNCQSVIPTKTMTGDTITIG